MIDAPSKIDDSQLNELGMKLNKKNKNEKSNFTIIFYFNLGIIAGTYVANDDEVLGNKIIGFIGFLVFVFMPHFSLQQMEGEN